MKHRSVVIFAIVAAFLAVAPQAAQQLDALRKNAANQVEGAIWNAFLNLQPQKRGGSREMARRTTPTAPAACPKQQEVASSRVAPQTEIVSTRRVAAPARSSSSNPRRDERDARRSLAEELASDMTAHQHLKEFDLLVDVQSRPVWLDKSAPLPKSKEQLASRPVFIDRETRAMYLPKHLTGKELARALSHLKATEDGKGETRRVAQVERRVRQSIWKGDAGRWLAEEIELTTDEERVSASQTNVLRNKARSKGTTPHAPTKTEDPRRMTVFPPVVVS
ncbi:MAG TPA: hypothetical protein VGB73_14380 [Pyrinomonadaceae bacterium]|jgi:hypothetical protein